MVNLKWLDNLTCMFFDSGRKLEYLPRIHRLNMHSIFVLQMSTVVAELLYTFFFVKLKAIISILDDYFYKKLTTSNVADTANFWQHYTV